MNVKVFYRDGVKSLLLVAALMLMQSCGFIKSKFGKGGKEERSGNLAHPPGATRREAAGCPAKSTSSE